MKDLLAAKCKYLSLDRRNMVLVNVIGKTKMFVWNAIEVCRLASSRRSDCGGDPLRDASKKGDGIFLPDLPRRPTTGSRTKDGRPRLLIRKSVEN